MHKILVTSLIGLIMIRISGIFMLSLPITLVFLSILMTALLICFAFPVWRKSPRACLWLSFVITIPFTTGVLNSFDNDKMFFGLIESTFAGIVFISAMMFARYQIRLDLDSPEQK